MSNFSLERAWRILVDSLWLAVIRAALTAIQMAVDILGLDVDGRRAVLNQLGNMILPSSSAGEVPSA